MLKTLTMFSAQSVCN